MDGDFRKCGHLRAGFMPRLIRCVAVVLLVSAQPAYAQAIAPESSRLDSARALLLSIPLGSRIRVLTVGQSVIEGRLASVPIRQPTAPPSERHWVGRSAPLSGSSSEPFLIIGSPFGLEIIDRSRANERRTAVDNLVPFSWWLF